MAKKSGQAKKNQKDQGTVRKIISGQRSTWWMVLVGFLAAAWIVWRLEPNQGLTKALIFGGLAWLVWLVFTYFSQRSARQGDE